MPFCVRPTGVPCIASPAGWAIRLRTPIDLTQGYFALLIEKDYLGDVRLREGRFRAFLLTSFKHFLSKERDRARALKRGGGQVPVSIDVREAEARHTDEPARQPGSRGAFRAPVGPHHPRAGDGSSRVRNWRQAGRGAEFEQLEGYLTGSEPRVRYQDVAERLGTTEGAVKKMVHRLRRRYGHLLREEIGATVAEPGDIDSELHHLLSAVRPWEPSGGVTFLLAFVFQISEG